MLFFGKKKNEKKHTSSQPSALRIGLRTAFSPEIGTSLRPIRSNINVFTEILAWIFVSQRMFPADHPAYVGRDGARLTLPMLFATVWKNLKVSKETMPQVALFAAVVISVGFVGLVTIVLLASAMMVVLSGKAHAAGYFTPTNAGDIAEDWIAYLFLQDYSGGFVTGVSGQPLTQAEGIEGALITALGYYSDAILVCAAVVMFYHLVSMTVETAHQGVIMGKNANQVWAPIRLVFAIGLLVPIGGGLNSGQYIVIKLADWGSGLATNVWGLILDSMWTFDNLNGVGAVPPYARETVYNTALMQACAEAYNCYQQGCQGGQQAQACSSGGGGGGGGGGSTQANAPSLKDGGFTPDPVCVKTVTGSEGDESNVLIVQNNPSNSMTCGHYNFAASPQQGSSKGCYTDMASQVAQWANQAVDHYVPKDMNGKDDSPNGDNNDQLDQITADYEGCLAGGLTAPGLSDVFMQSKDAGWASAGAVFSAIAQAESDANNDTSGLVPDTLKPDFNAMNEKTMKDRVAPAVALLDTWISQPSNPSSGGDGGTDGLGSDSCKGQRGDMLGKMAAMMQEGSMQGHVVEKFLRLVDWIAGWHCVWQSASASDASGATFSLGITFQGANPLAEMAHLGHSMIDTAYDLYDLYVQAMFHDSSSIMGKKLSSRANPNQQASGIIGLGAEVDEKMMNAVGSLILVVASTFLMSGIMLAYWLPLIPFMHFLFNILSWVLSVLEAVVCAPLLALAHLTPYGDGLPGQMAKRGYYYLFNIMLRPVLMVFGLVCGLLLFLVAVSYMNMFYMMAISTTTGTATGHVFLSRLVYSAIYVITLYVCANSAFKFIGYLPDHAIKWMGAEPLTFHRMGEPEQISGPLMQGANKLESGMAQGIGQMAQAAGGQKRMGGMDGGGQGGAAAAGDKALSKLGKAGEGGGKPAGGTTPTETAKQLPKSEPPRIPPGVWTDDENYGKPKKDDDNGGPKVV
jgi:conjugal transfer/type IV secretion protein DotA/TraY